MTPTPDGSSRWTGPAIALAYLAVLVAAGLRFHLVGDGESETDFFGAYAPQARAVLDGRLVIDPYRGPLYPIVLASLGVLLKPLGAGLFEAGIVLSAFSGAVVLLVLHRLLRRVFDPRTALWTTLLVAFNPLFVRYSYTTGNDMFFVALATICAGMAFAAKRRLWGRLVVLAFTLALAYLTRYIGGVLLLATLVCILFVDVWRIGWGKRLAATGVLVALFALFIAPWGFYCLEQRGEFFYNENYLNVAYSMLPAGVSPDQVSQIDYDALQSYGDVLRAASARQLASVPLRAWGHFASAMENAMRWPVGVFVIFGLVVFAVRRPDRRQLGYYVFGLLFFAALLLVFYNDRFGLFLVPVYATIAVGGILAVARTRVAGTLAVAALVGYGAFASIQTNRVLISIGDERVRSMGEWFVENVPESQWGGRVVARKPAFAYFARLEPAPLPVLASHDDLLDYLHRVNAHYFFYSEMGWRTRPQLTHLTDVGRDHPGLSLVKATRAGALYRVVR